MRPCNLDWDPDYINIPLVISEQAGVVLKVVSFAIWVVLCISFISIDVLSIHPHLLISFNESEWLPCCAEKVDVPPLFVKGLREILINTQSATFQILLKMPNF